jgi:hypothetical protein
LVSTAKEKKAAEAHPCFRDARAFVAFCFVSQFNIAGKFGEIRLILDYLFGLNANGFCR